jgi:hypothetical protein
MRGVREIEDTRPVHVRLMVVTLGTYPVKQLTTAAQVEAEIEVVGCLD